MILKKIKIHDPYISQKEKNLLNSTFQSHNWSSSYGGKNIQTLEKKFANYIGCDEAVSVNSGSAALELSLSLLNLKNKDVILPSLSHVSIANSVVHNGGNPIFVDINLETLNISEDNIKKKISSKTGLILLSHFGGYPCDISKISKLAKKFKVPIIEDAALATGSSYKNNRIGTHSFAVCFSFHPVKILSAPKGGMVCLNGSQSKKNKKLLTARRNNGIIDKSNYEVNFPGWNYYMDEFSAVLSISQLSKILKMLKIRKEIAKRYFNELNIANKMKFSSSCAYNFYWILVPNKKIILSKMNRKNIELVTYHPPIHHLKYFNKRQKLPNTDKVSKSLVLLPTHPNLSSKDIDLIIKNVNNLI